MDTVDIKALNERIQQESSFVDMINMEMNKVIVGQKHLVEGLLIGMLSNGHILLEGVPGLAKTLAINTLATTIDAKFSRIQFTPSGDDRRYDLSFARAFPGYGHPESDRTGRYLSVT